MGGIFGSIMWLVIFVLAKSAFDRRVPGLFGPRRSPFDPSRQFKRVAKRLGLTAKGATLRGTMKRLDVDVQAEAHATPERENEWRYDYRVAAYFRRSLRLGLNVSLAEGNARAYRLVSKVFDRRFTTRLRDPLLAGLLLRGEPEERLLAAAKLGLNVDVNDIRVAFRSHRQLGADDLEWFVQRAAELARCIGEARDRLAQSESKVADWPAVARALGAEWDVSLRTLTLDVEHGRVRAVMSQAADEVSVKLCFAHSLPSELSVVTAAAASSWDRWMGQDIVIGDAAFDEAFIVRAPDEAQAKRLLGVEVRELIVTLAAYTHRVAIERSCIELVLADTGPTAGEFRVVIDRMEDVVRMLGGRRKSVYR